MNFQEAFEKLFTFNDSAEAIVFGAILFVTFLLGLFIWALLAHMPQRRRLKKDIKLLRGELDTLSQTHQELEDKHSVQTAKVQRLEEEATKKELAFEEQNTKLNQIQQLYTHLEEERDAKVKEAQAAVDERNELQKLYKYAQLEIVESNDKEAEAIKTSRKALEKVENMKILMEEIEQDRQKAVDQKEEIEGGVNRLKEELTKANLAKDELHKDLGEALNQLAAFESKDLNGLAAENEQLKNEIMQLQIGLEELQKQRTETAEELDGYKSQESAVKEKEEAEDLLMDELLEAARSALSQQGLYQDIAEEDLVEDAELLESSLAQLDDLSSRGGIELEKEEIIELDEDDEESMARALEDATEAMNMQGFFQDIEEAVLLSIDEDDVDDEELMNRALDETAGLMQGNPFFSELGEDELVEDPELLLAQLQQEPEVAARGLGEEVEDAIIEWDDEEDALMSRALESANMAMNSEGLYTAIDPSKLIEPKEKKNELEENKQVLDPKYKTAMEQAVVAELGKSIPKANEMNKEDLKKINGIGTFIEERLNYLGFYRYEQIASIADKSYQTKLLAALGLPADAMARDQWIPQAKSLMTKQKINDLTKDININKLFKK